jgi:arginase
MSRLIDLIGVPSEAGGQNGTSSGPDVVGPYLASLLAEEQDLFAQYWNVRDHAHAPHLFMLRGKKCGNVYYKEKIAKIANLTAGCVSASLAVGHLPVVLGGDHSVAIGSGRAACDPNLLGGKTVGLIWIDAHYDAHTDVSSQSHNANGMPLATLLGHGLELFRPPQVKHDGVAAYTLPCPSFLPEHVLHLGAGGTDCEPEEKEFLDRLNVKMFSAKELIHDCVPAWMAIRDLLQKVDTVVVSFDLDAVDRAFAPAVHLQSCGGITRTLLLLIAEEVALSGKLRSVDIMEYKPAAEEFESNGVGRTLCLAGDFLLRLLGR